MGSTTSSVSLYYYSITMIGPVYAGLVLIFIAFGPQSIEPKTLQDVAISPCPDGWSEYQDSCYQLVTDLTTDSNMYRSLCQDAGGELASIHSADENSFVVSLLRTKSSGAVWTWLGGKCLGSDCALGMMGQHGIGITGQKGSLTLVGI